jgi:hypothetical protein
MVCVFNLITAIHDNLKVGYPYNDNRDYLITPHVNVCGLKKKTFVFNQFKGRK